MRGANRVGAFVLFGAFATFSSVANADEKADCISAFDRAQSLRADGKLTKTLAEYAVCARDVCPQSLRTQCVEGSRQVEVSIPSVVFSAKDATGADVYDVTIKSDDEVVATTLDGKAIPLDPGLHQMRFAMKGAPPIHKRVAVLEGQKNQVVSVSFEAPEDQQPKLASAKPAEAQNAQSPPSVASPISESKPANDDAETADADKPARYEQRWYGAYILADDGISFAVFTGGFVPLLGSNGDNDAVPSAVTLVGIGGYAFAAPITHWVEGDVGFGFLSLGLHVAGSVAAISVSATAIGDRSGGLTHDPTGAAAVAIADALLLLTPTAIDSIFLSTKRTKVLEPKKGESVRWSPTLQFRSGGGVVGVGGMF